MNINAVRMIRRTILPCLLVACATGLSAQQYFQQKVDYTISVRLDDVGHMLHGQESFTYTNNSPSSLDSIWIHLWPNAYRDRHSALCKQHDRNGDLDLHFAEDADRGWIDSLDFSIGSERLIWGYHPDHADIGWLKLPSSLTPGSSVTISTPFRVKIPDGRFSRLGHTGQAYYITQWYPKPAVYDATGWHAMPYLTSGEFYSEFGSFDVSVTLPANYVVGATGQLETTSERDLMDRMASSEWDYPTPVNDIRTGKPQYNGFPPSSEGTKTLRYTQDKVHDFAWFADKRFIVRKGEVAVGDRTVTTWALFTPRNKDVWAQGVDHINSAVKHYSEVVGTYPYDACTAVDGTISAGGGMEYPMITIIGNMDSPLALDNVITHEVGHNWFYGILGSNERDHAWMDEGMNSFVELLYMRKHYPNARMGISIPGLKKFTDQVKDQHRFQSEAGYRLNARRNLDQALSLTSNDFTEINYGTMIYMKTALIMDHLQAYLGGEMMQRCLHTYFDEWKFKHPQPEDMRVVFERESGQDLTWVFDGLIATNSKVDVKASALKKDQTLYLRNAGRDPIPVPVTAWNGGDSLGTKWFNATSGSAGYEHPWPNADRIVIDAGNRTLDIDRRNNEVRNYGLCKRGHLPKFEPFFGLEYDHRRSIYYAPAVAWNGHDGFQAGLVLHNTTFPSQRTEWVVAPLYGFGSHRFGGAARIERHMDRIRSGLFQNITLGLSGRMASTYQDAGVTIWYRKLSPYINFDLKRPTLVSPWKHAIALRSVVLWTGYTTADTNVYNVTRPYAEIRYRAASTSTLHPTTISPLFTASSEFTRLSVDVEQGYTYNAKKDQLRLHAFVGAFISKHDEFYSNRLNAWQLSWGAQDLLFDHAYLERGAVNGVTGAQFTKQQGAFKTPFAQGGSETWIGALNAELDLPIGLPVSLFASAGIVPTTTVTQEGRSKGTATYFEGGLGIQLVRDVVELWFPLVVSQRILDEEKFLGRQVTDRIRFVLALEKLDPTKMLRGLKP